MPDPLPFEYRSKWRSIPLDDPDALRRYMDQRDRELEDFLGKQFPVATTPGGSGLQAAARFANNESDATFGGSQQAVYWQSLPLSNSDNSSDFMAVEGGETNDRIDIFVPGFYTATAVLYDTDGGAGAVFVSAHDSGGIEIPDSKGSGGLVGPDSFGGTGATAFSSWAMDGNYFFHVEVEGEVGNTFFVTCTVEYVAPLAVA